MCGITGVWDFRLRKSPEVLESIVGRMTNALKHRGPDDSGIYCDPETHLTLGHRRLSIIDVSTYGHQPMMSSCHRYVIAYNGEVYNTEELRYDLGKSGRRFRGHSDTEVLLEGFSEYGPEQLLSKVNGIFAFALYDLVSQALWLGRDRMGVKPLHYGVFNEELLFGSELKALTTYEDWPRRINKDAVAQFLRNNYIPGTMSIYDGVMKVQPGELLRFDKAGNQSSLRYWSLEDVVRSSISNPIEDLEQARILVKDLLKDAVARQMVSDVPLGGLLSGGVDSSLIVSMMQNSTNRAVETFTIGFSENKYNEAVYARKISEILGTNHHELIINPSDVISLVPDLVAVYDEPFSDSSQVPTYLLSKMVQSEVTVALSGDGADELFGGYKRYTQMAKVARVLALLPPTALHGLSRIFRGIPEGALKLLFRTLPLTRNVTGLAERSRNLVKQITTDSDNLYAHMHCHWPNPERLMSDDYCPRPEMSESKARSILDDDISRWQYLDSKQYLPDDILVKIDRASMANSLEVRVPFLDHRLVELSWQISQTLKTRSGVGKFILRNILADYLPIPFVERPKMGFGIPINEWLRDPLKEWAEDLINPNMIKKHGILKASLVWEYWKEHQSGRYDWGYWLWDVITLQAWLEANCNHMSVR